MKRIVLILMFLLLMSAACNGGAAETTQIPMVARMSQSTTIPDDYPELTQSLLPKVDQEDIVAAYPGSAELGDIAATEAPLAIVEPTPSLDAYPGLVGTEEAAPADLPLPTVEPISSIGTNPGSTVSTMRIPTYSYEIVNIFPHDRGSHLQGLIVDDDPGILLEGSGLWGESSLRRVDLETGEVTQILSLPDQYFGEGITVFNNRIIQLTWKSGVGFIYDSDSFDLLDVFSYAHEGWGITHDGQQLIVSDGTATIYFWDPETLQETRQITVNDEYGPVVHLNELEFVDGEIFANVWQTDTIVRIDPDSGQVTGRIDLSGLLAQEDREGTEGVLNGIAYDSEAERLFVAGKRWPTLYEVELVLLDAPE